MTTQTADTADILEPQVPEIGNTLSPEEPKDNGNRVQPLPASGKNVVGAKTLKYPSCTFSTPERPKSFSHVFRQLRGIIQQVIVTNKLSS